MLKFDYASLQFRNLLKIYSEFFLPRTLVDLYMGVIPFGILNMSFENTETPAHILIVRLNYASFVLHFTT